MTFIRQTYYSLTDWLTETNRHKRVLFVFSKLFYLWMALMALQMYPLIDVLWSKESLILGVYLDDGLINNFFLKLTYRKELGMTIWWIHLVGVVLSLLGLLGRLPRLAVYLTGFMMFYGAPAPYNGGYLLALNYAFILIFYSGGKDYALSRILDNLVWLALVVQLCVVYLDSALFKWLGDSWTNGDAIYYSSFIDVYFRQGMGKFMQEHYYLSVFLTYITLAYQTLFPIVIWFKKIKLPFLLIGIMMHLFIGVFMCLPFFGFIMILGYILLVQGERVRAVAKE